MLKQYAVSLKSVRSTNFTAKTPPLVQGKATVTDSCWQKDSTPYILTAK